MDQALPTPPLQMKAAAAELGLAHQKKQQQGLFAPSQLQAVADHAWTALRARH